METEWLRALFRTKTPRQIRQEKLFPNSERAASFTVNAKATYYPYMAKVYIPDKPWSKLQDGIETERKFVREKSKKKQDEDDVERSLRRSKNHVRDYILCNRFEIFCTFTFRDDRHDIEKCRAKMSNWLKLRQRRNGSFVYLIVPELHKDGALHFHALLKDYPGKVTEATNARTGLPLRRKGRQAYNIPGYTLGHTNAAKITDDQTSYAKLSNYVRKYITKDMPLFYGKKRYWGSQKLVKPEVELNPTWYLSAKPDKVTKSEYGTTLIYLNNNVIPERYRFQLYQVQTLPGILENA